MKLWDGFIPVIKKPSLGDTVEGYLGKSFTLDEMKFTYSNFLGYPSEYENIQELRLYIEGEFLHMGNDLMRGKIAIRHVDGRIV